MTEVTFGEWLKRRRKGMGWTQRQLAAQVNCSTIMLRKLEAEERRPSVQIGERLAEIFNIPQHERTSFLRFARGDWRSAPISEYEDTPWRASATPPRSKLPASLTSLIGREPELASLYEYLSDGSKRLLTLIGPPGIGKTRLSIESARLVLSEFPDGVFFVALAPLDGPSLIAPSIVQVLGYIEAKNQPASHQLVDAIGDKQMLLVLDNCEHLIEDVALLVSDFLSACPHLKILATSREALRVTGEWVYTVPALGLPEDSISLDIATASSFPALTLFAERAHAVRSDFALHADNIDAVASICSRLDGLPLAIELVAARTRLMSPLTLLERFSDQSMLFIDGMRAVPARQKTLNDAIAWSYDLLSEEEQKLFAYLSVFSGGFTLEAAESILSPTKTNQSVTDIIASLFDKSLLQRVPDREAHTKTRFNMLVTIQQFALDRLRFARGESEAHDRHLTYFLDLAEQGDKEIYGPDPVKWMERLEVEYYNFHAAIDWCVSEKKTEYAMRLLGALGWTWTVQNHCSEMRSWLGQIRSLPDIDKYPALHARLLNNIGRQNYLLGEFHEGRSVLKESEAIWSALGVKGERGLAEALRTMGWIVILSEGDLDKAQSLFGNSLELYQEHGDQRGIVNAMISLATVAYERDEDALALSLLEQSLDLSRQSGDVWGIRGACQILGQLFLKQGSYERARQYFEEHLRIDENLRYKEGTLIALTHLGHLYRRQRDYDQAEHYYEKSVSMSREFGLKWDGDSNLYFLGIVALHRSRYLQARQLFIDYFHSTRGSTDKLSAYDFLTGMAAVAAGATHPERAARLSGAAEGVIVAIDYRIPPFDRAEFDRYIQTAREQLGDAKFAALASEGRALTMEEAVAYALEEHGR